MNDAELLAEHLRAIEYLMAYGDLTETDRLLARQRMMVLVGKMRSGVGEVIDRRNGES